MNGFKQSKNFRLGECNNILLRRDSGEDRHRASPPILSFLVPPTALGKGQSSKGAGKWFPDSTWLLSELFEREAFGCCWGAFCGRGQDSPASSDLCLLPTALQCL